MWALNKNALARAQICIKHSSRVTISPSSTFAPPTFSAPSISQSVIRPFSSSLAPCIRLNATRNALKPNCKALMHISSSSPTSFFFLTPQRSMGTTVTRKRAAPISSDSAFSTSVTSLTRSIPRPLVQLQSRNIWFLPTRKASAAAKPPVESVSSSILSSLSAEASHAASMSGSQLFDASHLLSGLHEDKKERLRCLEVNDSGQHRDVEFSRAELSAMLELHPRDLRFLDSSMRNLPSVLARRKVIIVNLEMFKALITADRVLMFDPWYPHVQSVVQPLQAAVLNGGELYDGQPVPFEFIALEHILLTVCRNLEDRFDLYISSLEPLLSSSSTSTADTDPTVPSARNCPSAAFAASVAAPPSFTALVADGSGSTLMHLLQLKNGLTSFEVTLRETAAALRDLLETDEDMAQMYLSVKKQTGINPLPSEHGEVEVILETYLRKVDELENEVEQNVKSITLTEEHIQIRLDSNRNSMMKMDLFVSISTLGVTTAALGAGLFGMNLPTQLEGNPYAFWCVTALWVTLAAAVVRRGLKLASKRGIDLFQIEPNEPTLRHIPRFDQPPNAEKLSKLKKQRQLRINSPRYPPFK